jgi:hypothetical protein
LNPSLRGVVRFQSARIGCKQVHVPMELDVNFPTLHYIIQESPPVSHFLIHPNNFKVFLSPLQSQILVYNLTLLHHKDNRLDQHHSLKISHTQPATNPKRFCARIGTKIVSLETIAAFTTLKSPLSICLILDLQRTREMRAAMRGTTTTIITMRMATTLLTTITLMAAAAIGSMAMVIMTIV